MRFYSRTAALEELAQDYSMDSTQTKYVLALEGKKGYYEYTNLELADELERDLDKVVVLDDPDYDEFSE